jgi:HPt (histidine-containing phosphotransfer) domain-containing protein
MSKTKTDVNKTANDLTKVAQDAAYVAIGLGVLGFQRAQVRRRELQSQLEGLQGQLGQVGRRTQTPVTDLRKEVAKAMKEFDKTFGQLIERWDATVEPVSERLPAGAQAALQQAKEARDQLRSYLTSLAA